MDVDDIHKENSKDQPAAEICSAATPSKVRAGVAAVLFLVILFWILAIYSPNYLKLEWITNVGDRASAISALFSGLALLGVVVAILLQREELILQRKELEDTRAELHRSAEAQERIVQEAGKQVEALQITAELTAINAMIAEHGDELAKDGKILQTGPDDAQLRHREQIKSLVDEITDFKAKREALLKSLSHRG